MNDQNDLTSMQQSLSYAFLLVAKAHRHRAQQLLSELGIHVGQDAIIMHLSETDGLTMSDIVERVCKQPATITKMVNRMERAGLVERRPDPDDGRAKRIYLTDVGRDVWSEIGVAWDQLNAETVSQLSDDEQKTLRNLLGKMLDALQPVGTLTQLDDD